MSKDLQKFLLALLILLIFAGVAYLIYLFTRKRWRCVENKCKFDALHGNHKSEKDCQDNCPPATVTAEASQNNLKYFCTPIQHPHGNGIVNTCISISPEHEMYNSEHAHNTCHDALYHCLCNVDYVWLPGYDIMPYGVWESGYWNDFLCYDNCYNPCIPCSPSPSPSSPSPSPSSPSPSPSSPSPSPGSPSPSPGSPSPSPSTSSAPSPSPGVPTPKFVPKEVPELPSLPLIPGPIPSPELQNIPKIKFPQPPDPTPRLSPRLPPGLPQGLGPSRGLPPQGLGPSRGLPPQGLGPSRGLPPQGLGPSRGLPPQGLRQRSPSAGMQRQRRR